MNWTIFFLMLPHLKPKCISYFWPELYRGIDVLRVISLLIVCVLLIKKKKLPSLPSVLLGLLESWICFVTLITRGDIVETCSLAVSVMAIVLLVDLYSDQMGQLITSLTLNYEWIVYANLITVLKDPECGVVLDWGRGLFSVPIYFFGPDNWFMYLCIPALCVALLYLRLQVCEDSSPRKTAKLLRGICLILACYITVFICLPVTTVVAMLAFAAVLIAGWIPGVHHCIIFPVVLLGGIAANLAISVFRVMETVPFLKTLIQDVLQKGLTLSGRTGIWDFLQERIGEHLWLGIGTPKGGYEIIGQFLDHMHNQIFDLLAQGGIPALVLFSAVLVLVGVQLTIQRKVPSAKIMTAAMAGLLVMCIPEVCRHGSIFLLFPLAYYVSQIESICVRAEL